MCYKLLADEARYFLIILFQTSFEYKEFQIYVPLFHTWLFSANEWIHSGSNWQLLMVKKSYSHVDWFNVETTLLNGKKNKQYHV